jgi:putative DNA primase/helicase
MAIINLVPPVEPQEPEAIAYTELAQAKKFIDMSDDTLRYVEELDRWFRWNGRYWENISKLVIVEDIRQMNRQDALCIPKGKGPTKQMCSLRFARNIEGFCRGDRRCLLELEELDADPWLLGTPDGIFDLRTGERIPEDQRPYVMMVTAVAPADVADKTTCPVFLKFMGEFTCADEDLRRFLLQYAGYSLTGDMREQCLIFLYGDGDNGKTVFLHIVRNLLGDYAMTAAVDLFATTSIGKHATGFADLHRKRCVITNETQEGQTLRMDKIKGITGQDLMRANFMRKDNFEFLPVCKLFMFGNHKPNLPDVGKAVKKRIRMVPCDLRLEAGQMDKDLPAKLLAEGPGILRALIDGCRDWQEHGLKTPKCVQDETDDYFSTQDVFNNWLEDCCIVDANAKVSSADLWGSWSSWAEHRKLKIGTDTELSERLKLHGFVKKDHVLMSDGTRPRGWEGLALIGQQYEMPNVGPEPPPHTKYPHDF